VEKGIRIEYANRSENKCASETDTLVVSRITACSAWVRFLQVQCSSVLTNSHQLNSIFDEIRDLIARTLSS